MKFRIGQLFLLAIFTFHIFAWCENFEIKSAETERSALKTDLSQLHPKKPSRDINADRCADCHLLKTKRFLKKEHNPERAHELIKNIHGKREMSCNSCHDINNRNQLLSSKDFPADFSISSPVCAQCHIEKFKDWQKGLHGKRSGGWMTPKEQYQCVHCHDAHSVKYPSTESLRVPYQAPSVIPIHQTLPER